MTPDQATIILENVGLPTANAEHPVTKRVIGAIPPNKVDYRPDDIVKSAIDLAWHIVTAEVRFLNAVSSGAFDLTPMPRPDSIRTADDVTIVPVLEEVLVIEKQLILKEELHIRRPVTTEKVQLPVSLKKQRAIIERVEPEAKPRK